MKFLVTGAAGFIGFYTARALLDRGDEVIGIDNLSPYYDVNLKKARLAQLEARNRFTFIEADISDHIATEKVFASTNRNELSISLRRPACVTRLHTPATTFNPT